MSVLVCDSFMGQELIERRKASGLDRFDEVWDGVYVMPPMANNEHQSMAFRLGNVTSEVVPPPRGAIFVGVNVSDREEGWTDNFRVPDVAIFLVGNPAKDCETHWCGGPDWAAEILSEGDRAREKLAFYAKIGVRELVLIDRDPWGIELYQLQNGKLTLVGTSSLAQPDELASAVLPLLFRLVVGVSRPLVLISETNGSRQWHV